ncbi:MAG: hypothetical protein LBE09_04605 [Christensenellaceae bacterium]|jgi:hypothetical protein|nr:hypothetical protein [Christensenellaceae bacterium]
MKTNQVSNNNRPAPNPNRPYNSGQNRNSPQPQRGPADGRYPAPSNVPYNRPPQGNSGAPRYGQPQGNFNPPRYGQPQGNFNGPRYPQQRGNFNGPRQGGQYGDPRRDGFNDPNNLYVKRRGFIWLALLAAIVVNTIFYGRAFYRFHGTNVTFLEVIFASGIRNFPNNELLRQTLTSRFGELDPTNFVAVFGFSTGTAQTLISLTFYLYVILFVAAIILFIMTLVCGISKKVYCRKSLITFSLPSIIFALYHVVMGFLLNGTQLAEGASNNIGAYLFNTGAENSYLTMGIGVYVLLFGSIVITLLYAFSRKKLKRH